ncbi:DUF885 domain-containing protein [Konateibacter massiliensis]|uniref:DUF885 domain-containing protein n=1 Tax=Konateibacter massiliensis TaxID=2002841 RepID=UPI000C15E468|nr:DUF885 domain-containing protein [Konateibacter massiliensis]
MLHKCKKYLGLFCCALFGVAVALYFASLQNVIHQTASMESTQASFQEFTTRLFQTEVTENTLSLHYTLQNPENYAIEEYPITFGDFSEQSLLENEASLEEYIKELQTFPYNELSKNQQLTYDLLYDYYSSTLENWDLTYYSEVLSPTTGTQAQLPILLAEYSFHSEQDVIDYLTLLTKMDDYYSSILSFEKRKSDIGLFMSDEVAAQIIDQCNDFIAEPEQNYLLTTFNSRVDELSALSDSAKSNYKLQNKSILYSDVIPAYHILIEGLTDLAGTCVNSQGLCYFENGQRYYEYLVQSSTGSSKSIFELKKLLNAYMKNDLTQMAQIAAEDPTILTASDSYSFDLTDPALILEDLKLKISTDFPTPPDANYTVKYVDSSLSKHLSPAFYLTPPIDNIADNSIYINPENNYSKIDLYTTLAHEGYPGHLYQNIYFNYNNTDPIRNLLNYSGYSEGWATYVEMYSYQLADIDSNLAKVLQLNNAITLYLYANMDIGIHYDGWTLKDTADYLADYGIENEDTVSDVYCAILSEPANYLKYCIGYLEFMELKKTAKNALGSDFSLKDFHQFLLDTGPAPFSIIEKYMNNWINDNF